MLAVTLNPRMFLQLFQESMARLGLSQGPARVELMSECVCLPPMRSGMPSLALEDRTLRGTQASEVFCEFSAAVKGKRCTDTLCDGHADDIVGELGLRLTLRHGLAGFGVLSPEMMDKRYFIVKQCALRRERAGSPLAQIALDAASQDLHCFVQAQTASVSFAELRYEADLVSFTADLVHVRGPAFGRAPRPHQEGHVSVVQVVVELFPVSAH